MSESVWPAASPRTAQRQEAGSAQPAVELHIGTLVLDGFAAIDGAAVTAGLERELARLFAERGVPATWDGDSSLAELDAGAIRLPANADAGSIGIQLAEQIYRALEG